MSEAMMEGIFTHILATRSEEELEQLSLIKRFMEYLTGDANFRAALTANAHNIRPVLVKYGLDLDPDSLRPLFDRRYMQYRFERNDGRWPDARLWDAFISDKLRYRSTLRAVGSTAQLHPRFEAWRRRQIGRCAAELGTQSDGIVHALVSYELSKGCSVGCWFCGISAERFGGHFPYTAQNRDLWRGVIGAMVDRFGQAVGTGFCYWATDPCDNPDYADFLADHHAATGIVPQTTTAAPLKNIALTRRVLAFSEQYPTTINRFSILTTPILRRVFAAFTPRELLGVELVMQQKDSIVPKSLAGRAIEKADTLEAAISDAPATIACVTGFLVNMPERRIRLVSPTRSCEEWPDGFRVFAERRFEDARGFGVAVDSMMDEVIRNEFNASDIVRFRPGLTVDPIADGFIARTNGGQQTYRHGRFGRQLGELLLDGRRTFSEVVERLCDPVSPDLELIGQVQSLLDCGLLDDSTISAPRAPL